MLKSRTKINNNLIFGPALPYLKIICSYMFAKVRYQGNWAKKPHLI